MSDHYQNAIDYPDVPLSVALVNSNLPIQERLWALEAINERRALRAERDAALARVKDAQTERELLASRLQDLLSDRGSNAPQSMASLSAYLELAHQERDKAKADNERLRDMIAAISIHDPFLPASLWKKVQAVVDERNAAMRIDQELSQ